MIIRNVILQFRIANNSPARCPHCRKVSAVGPHYARGRALLYGIAGLILLAVGLGITIATYRIAASSGGIYVVYVGTFTFTMFLCLIFAVGV